jgi:alpha-amylase/alpha-mannosidase (GH57 family)
MPKIRVVFLWHMHQPFYKDLVTGEYRLPWVRLHALKDYYGMVKLLDEFPGVHQTFNLVPSLIAQIQDYAAGTARDPFFDVATKPTKDWSAEERRFALTYLFQANADNLIGRYPRYRELWEKLRSAGADAAKAERYFSAQDLTDLQVLSQLAWFDEFFLEEPEVAALVAKGKEFSLEDQRFVCERERELIGRVLPAYAEATKRGGIEISSSPYYHPILPLLCDTGLGRVSSPGLPLPRERFRHPEDARAQLVRGLDLHEQVFGVRPRGAWPSEGSVADEVMRIGHEAGLEWMATDEGVLGRSLGMNFARDEAGQLSAELATKLYSVWRFEQGETRMHLIFRDHALSDLIGFVYSGMPAKEAADHLIHHIREAAQPVLDTGKDAMVPIILDGENAWEYYPRSGRDFLRYVCDRLSRDEQMEPVTVSEAIARQRDIPTLSALTPGSWINANFNVWIGAPEDNKAWDHLSAARERYSELEQSVAEAQRALAYEELLIAEGSDWNWWYGPEHHTANNRDFDDLYRKHLSNVYQALGQAPPDALAQPIVRPEVRATFVPQTAHIHPRVDGDVGRYFDWIGAAMYTADRRASAMHGKQFLLDSLYAGVDDQNLYARVDFIGGTPPAGVLEMKLHCAARDAAGSLVKTVHLTVTIADGKVSGWRLASVADDEETALPAEAGEGLGIGLHRMLECRMPLATLGAASGGRIGFRVTLWREHLPVDALPAEGEMMLDVLGEGELAARA